MPLGLRLPHTDDRTGVTAALCIGVSRFDDPEIATLVGAARQTASLCRALVDPNGCALDPTRVELLGEKLSPKTSEIVEAMKRATASAQADDVLFIYFSGHAYRDGPAGDIYLCGRDTFRNDLNGTGISAAAFAASLEPNRARGVLLVLDCCVSAGFAEEAPLFFRRAENSEFRIVFAASRSNEPSWELADHSGTLFSKHLIEVLSGRTPVGVTPGHIKLAGLVDAIDFGLNEDLQVLHPDVPPQRPLIAGSYGGDPLLFVHRRNKSAGLSVDAGRISRGLHRKTVRNVFLGFLGLTAFLGLSYLSVVNGTRYAEAVDANTVRVFQGHPDFGAPTYPRLVRELPLASPALRADSPLRNGKPLVASPGKSIDALIESQLNDIGTIGRMIEQGRQQEARAILLRLLDAPVLDPERAHYVRVMFPQVATQDDLARLRDLTNAARSEVRSMAIVGLLRLVPQEAFSTLEQSLGDQTRFDQRAIIQHIAAPCPDGGASYFSAAARTALFNGAYSTLADVAARTKCGLDQSAIYHLIGFWPSYQLEDLARYADLFGVKPPRLQELDTPDRLPNLMLFRADGADPNCMTPFVRTMASSANTAVARDRLKLQLTSNACRSQLHVAAEAPSADGPLLLRAMEDGDNRPIDIQMPFDAQRPIPAPLIDHLSRWLASGPSDQSAKNIETVLQLIASKHNDLATRANALMALSDARHPLVPSSDMLASSSLELRYAAYECLSRLRPDRTAGSLMARINDADLVDWPELISLVPPKSLDLSEVRRLSQTGVLAKQRAAAALVMYGEPQDLAALSDHADLDTQRALRDYLAARTDLEAIATATKTTAAVSSTWTPSLAQLISIATAEQRRLKEELAQTPETLRIWRATQILAARKNAFDAGFQRVMSPGAKIWLEQYIRPRALTFGQPAGQPPGPSAPK
ncbi:caspase family protein [Bradyrhizobium sp. Arg68]|uniref:caspase family protein n=1 Tax=Bradyrhizobium ivorense TaxID=2511166 RepID=UPI001E459125|nr:caspase family protein [Bradyrhizobium ivorense]MCC8935607.1 caspase family protein [Bradyrhizobium ivorense]